MTTKKFPAMKLLSFTTETTLAEIGQYVGIKPKELMDEAQQLGLRIEGPQHWIYYGMDGNPQTRFKLEIGIPIAVEASVSETFAYTQTQPIECAVITHHGAWETLHESYAKIIGEIMASGKTMSGITRELYRNVDFEKPERNITEIQIGLM